MNDKTVIGTLGMEAEINQPSMFMKEIIHPFKTGLTGTFEFLTAKAVIIASSWPAFLSLNLFETPREWWQGLIYLVILDWLAGVIRAIYNSEFDAAIAVQKWYSVVGYMIVCGGAAIISNTFDVFYFFQFLVYLTFFLKEFVSILRTFKMLALVQVTWQLIWNRDFSPETLDTFMDKVDARHEKTKKERSKKID